MSELLKNVIKFYSMERETSNPSPPAETPQPRSKKLTHTEVGRFSYSILRSSRACSLTEPGVTSKSGSETPTRMNDWDSA